MDLSSLPDEMLTIILQHTKFGRVMKLRKMNTRIDALAKRNCIWGRVPVDKFEFEREKNHNRFGERLCEIKLTFAPGDDMDLGVKSPIIVRTTMNLKETVNKYFRRILIQKELVIGVADVVDGTMAMMHKMNGALQYLTKLQFQYANIEVSDKWARRMYSEIFPHVDTIIMYHCYNYQQLFNEEVLRDRKWKRLYLNKENSPHIFLENKFLNEIVLNCKEVKIVNYNSRFTIFGIIDLLKSCIAADGTYNRKFDVGSITVFELSFLEIQTSFYDLFKEDLNGRNILINYEEGMTLAGRVQRKCKLTFEDEVDAPYLHFSFTTAVEIDNMQ